MLHEMVSTQAMRGLFNGSSGFCPVAATKDMPRELIQTLADLGKRQYDTAAAGKALGREMYCHLPLTLHGRRFHLVSRGFQKQGDDPSTQKYIVHQLLLENVRALSAGPAWLLANDQVWINEWNVEPQFLESRQIEGSVLSPRICETWTRMTGDAGWAGAALEAWQRRKPFVLVIPPDKPTRPIIDMLVEAQSLMEPQIRWEIPIAISAWHPAKYLQRMWIAYQAGTQDAMNAFRSQDGIAVDITRKLEPAANMFSEVARAGTWAKFSTADGKAHTKGPAGVTARKSISPNIPSATTNGSLARSEPVVERRVRNVGSLATAWGGSRSFRRKETMRLAITWIKRGLALAALVLLGFGIWKGAQFLQTVAVEVYQSATRQPANSTEKDISPTLRDTAAVSAPKNGNQNPSNASSDIDSDGEVDADRQAAQLVGLKSAATHGLTSAAAQRLFTQLQAACPYMELPVEVSEHDFVAFTIPGPEPLLGALGFGLATPHQFVALQKAEGGKTWSLQIDNHASANSARATLSSTILTDDGGGQVQLAWKWQTPPDEGLAAEIRSGALCMWLLSDRDISLAIPLSAPAAGKPIRLVTAMLEGVTFSPHLPSILVRPEIASKIKWFAEPISFAKAESPSTKRDEEDEDLWFLPRSAENSTSLWRMNSRQLQREIEAELGANPQEKDENVNESLQQLVDRTAPIQFEIRLDPPSYIDAKDERMVTRAKTILFMKTEDGSTNSVIFQHQPQPGKIMRQKEFEAQVESALIRWLSVNLDLEPQLVEAMSTGKRYSPKSSANVDVRVKSAFAQRLFQAFMERLDRDFEFRVLRSTTLTSELREFEVPISAYQGK